MTDDYTAWLDEHLGAMIRYHLQLEPRVAAGYARAFRGDAVGSQWLGVAAEAAPVAAPAPVAEGTSVATEAPAAEAAARLPIFAEVPDDADLIDEGAVPSAPEGLAAYEDSLSTDAENLALYDDSLPADLDPLLRSTVEELLPYLSAEDRTAVLTMDAEELAAAVEEARAESNDGLVPDLPAPSTDAVLTNEVAGEGAELPFADVPDDELAEAVTGSIAPPDAPADLKAELDELAAHMTDEEKAAFADLTVEEITAALDQAHEELAAEMPSAGVDDDALAEATR